MPAILTWLRSPQVMCAAFLVCLAIPTLLYTSYTLNYNQQTERIEQSAKTVSQHIGMRVGEMRTLMAALVSLHHKSSNELDNTELLLFSEQFLERSDYITSIGRYDYLDHSERKTFETHMSENGLFDFKLTELDRLGRLRPRAKASHYYPISLLDPMVPETLKLIGSDLAADPEFLELLDGISVRNESLVASLPDAWPLGGDLVLLRPVYLGTLVPSLMDSRLEQSDGGFWVTINIEKLLSGMVANQDEFDLRMEIQVGANQKILHQQEASNPLPLWFGFLHPKKTFTEEWPSFSSSLILTIQQEVGYTGASFAYTLISLTCLLAVSLLWTSHVIYKRRRGLERQRNKDALLEERAKAEKTLNSVQDAIITLDANLNISHINASAVIQFNAKPSKYIGCPLEKMLEFQLVDKPGKVFDIAAALANLGFNSKEEFDVAPFGHAHDDFILRLALTTSNNYDGIPNSHVLVLRDISHEKRLTTKLAYQANYDALTGCCNRYYFEQTLTALLEELPFNDKTHTLCYMDLDQFKVINDTCGHQAGDRLLIELTENMRLAIRDRDVLTRLGGDEFGLLMIDVDLEQAQALCDRIYAFYQNYVFHHEDKAFAVRASIGVVHIDQSCGTLMDVMASADIAVYAAKDSGRNSMIVFSKDDDTMTERSVELSWLPRLQNALQRDEFRLHAQAVALVKQLDTNSAHSHFEFLLRLANADGTESTPWQFIQAAERYDLMREIDKWVIRNALRIMSELKGGPGGDCTFSINLSGQSAADPTLKHFIREQIEHYQINPGQIWFELTETAAIAHFSIAVDLINSIRSLGAKVALDDFGSGLSSFGYLKNLPVDIIKIDGQFVKEIAKNPIDREMVRAMHQVGRSMGIETVAEFVENQDILDELANIGIDYAQGYHIGKPLPISEAIDQLTKGSSKAA